MGLLAREVEAAGVTTVGLALIREQAAAAHAPRMLFIHWPFGHALGEPGQVEQQRIVLRDMLSMARRAPSQGWSWTCPTSGAVRPTRPSTTGRRIATRLRRR